jgi:hypothetical protein
MILQFENSYDTTYTNIDNLASECFSKFGFYPISTSLNNNIPIDNCQINDIEMVSVNSHNNWDTPDILDIIKNNNLPIFNNISSSPTYTMINYPKNLLNEIKIKKNDPSLNKLYYLNLLKNFINNNLTNTQIIKYILRVIKMDSINNVLFISSDMKNRLSNDLYNGLKNVFGSNCDILFPNNEIQIDNILKCSNEINNYSDEIDKIINNIKNKYYDIIVFGSIQKSNEFLDLVLSIYKKEQIIGVFGSDLDVNNNIFINRIKSYITLFVKEIINVVDVVFNINKMQPSDINEHLEILFEYASKCESVIELGVRGIVSSWAFAKGLINNNKPTKKILMNDIDDVDATDFILEVRNYGIDAKFIKSNDLDLDIEENYDITFIDTWHVYAQLKRELEKFSKITNKYIIMHDTTVDEIYGESLRLKCNIEKQSITSGYPINEISKGLGPAWIEFLINNPEWKLKQRFYNNNGLTILEKI